MRDKGATFTGAIDRLLYLSMLPIFGSLPSNELAVLAEHATEKFYRRGRTVIDGSRPIDAIHIVVEGRITAGRSDRPQREYLSGAPVGVLALLAQLPQGFGATASEDTLTLSIDADILRDVIEEHFSIFEHVLTSTAAMFLRSRERSPLASLGDQEQGTRSVTDRPLDLVERMFFLRDILPFEAGKVSALLQFAQATQEVRIPAGAEIWAEGEDASRALVIVTGTTEGFSRRQPEPVRFWPGAFAGSLDSVARLPRAYGLRATTDVVGLWLGTDALLDICEDRIDVGMALLQTIALGTLETREQELARTMSGPSERPPAAQQESARA